MKFTYSVDINAPIDKVLAIFNNKTNNKYWQDGFDSYEQLSGTLNSTGATAMITYKTKWFAIKLTETILSSNLPNEITGLYEHSHDGTKFDAYGIVQYLNCFL